MSQSLAQKKTPPHKPVIDGPNDKQIKKDVVDGTPNPENTKLKTVKGNGVKNSEYMQGTKQKKKADKEMGMTETRRVGTPEEPIRFEGIDFEDLL